MTGTDTTNAGPLEVVDRPAVKPTRKAAEWEAERAAAAAALAGAGASAREVRVLATLAASAARTMRLTSSWRGEDPAATLDRAVARVLEAHRAGGAA